MKGQRQKLKGQGSKVKDRRSRVKALRCKVEGQKLAFIASMRPLITEAISILPLDSFE